MVFKPLDESIYLKYIKMVGWSLKKGSIDYKLYDENGYFVCSIKISHGKKSDKGVVAHSVKKTEQEFKQRGWSWPPRKKSKNT
jgi:hypothetical protein